MNQFMKASNGSALEKHDATMNLAIGEANALYFCIIMSGDNGNDSMSSSRESLNLVAGIIPGCQPAVVDLAGA